MSSFFLQYRILHYHDHIPSPPNPLPTLTNNHHSVAFASIRDKIRQQRDEQASRKLSHRLVVGPDTRRASNVLITTPGNRTTTTIANNATINSATTNITTTKDPNTTTGVGNDASSLKPIDSTSSTSLSGSRVGVEFVVSDLTVTAQRLEQVGVDRIHSYDISSQNGTPCHMTYPLRTL